VPHVALTSQPQNFQRTELEQMVFKRIAKYAKINVFGCLIITLRPSNRRPLIELSTADQKTMKNTYKFSPSAGV
jgi:hypothetical protein